MTAVSEIDFLLPAALYDTVSCYPTAQQPQDLAAIEWCTRSHLYRYFANRCDSVCGLLISGLGVCRVCFLSYCIEQPAF